MRDDVLASLRCPVCRGGLSESGSALRCPSGHAFDVARQGYVSFLAGKGSRLIGDDAQMVAARERFLGAGHLAPLAEAIASSASKVGAGLVVEVGAGTAYYLAKVLDAVPASVGLALDISRYASRRAARSHERLVAITADARAELPLADACASVVLDVFAPRPARELRRIVREDGLLVVATPAREHLSELRPTLGLLEIDEHKERRLEQALSPGFHREGSVAVRWPMTLARSDVVALTSMGPSAHHLPPSEIGLRAAALPEPVLVTASCRVDSWRPARG